jgi:16S rRNA processing protein RimM
VPFVKAIVPEVDVAAGVLVIDPPPGLLDPENHGPF